MNTLPICDIPMTDAKMRVLSLGDFLSEKTYPKFHPILTDTIHDLVGADCWALVLNGNDVLYNNYNDTVPHMELNATEAKITRETEPKITREDVINTPALITHHGIKSIEIYMFGEQPWKVSIKYNEPDNTYEFGSYTYKFNCSAEAAAAVWSGEK